MGHYRPRRPRLNEDPMKTVEILHDTVHRIQQGKFRGFSNWTPGVPTPEEHARRRIGRLRALNHGVEPRLGISVTEARNHSRYVKAMVSRIKNLQSPRVRSKDFLNTNMHPALLRRPVTKTNQETVEAEPIEQTPQNKKKKQKKEEWVNKTVIDTPRTPATEQHVAKYLKTARQHSPGTPYCFTPKPHTKLIDGTHLCDRYNYDDARSQKKYFSGADNERLEEAYREVVDNPQGLATITTKPWKQPPPPQPDYDPDWRIDMRLDDLPCDLKATPSRHTLDDPVRPSSSRKPYHDVFREPHVIYDENWVPLSLPCNTPSSEPSPNRKMKDSCTTPTRPHCSRSKHVHREDLEQKPADPVGNDMSFWIGETIRNLQSIPGHETPVSQSVAQLDGPYSVPTRPHSPVYHRPESPVSTTSRAASRSPATSSGNHVHTQHDNSDPDEGQILLNYEPKDQPLWTLPTCCSTPY